MNLQAKCILCVVHTIYICRQQPLLELQVESCIQLVTNYLWAEGAESAYVTCSRPYPPVDASGLSLSLRATCIFNHTATSGKYFVTCYGWNETSWTDFTCNANTTG